MRKPNIGSGAGANPPCTIAALAAGVDVGDLVFIRIGAALFGEVSAATGCWANHVGVVVDTSGPQPLVGESRVPISGTTTLARFARRSAGGRIAVARPRAALTPAQQRLVAAAARRRNGILYDTGFDLHSRRQFCSRYVREILAEATGTTHGEIETFADLLRRNPEARLGFWRLWYFGSIPWARQTVTPASVLRSAELETVFDGHVGARRDGPRAGT